MFRIGSPRRSEINMDDNNILILLEQQNDNFPAMAGFLKEKGLTSTTLLLAQSLKGVAEEIGYRNELLIECFSYLDIVKIYSLVTYNDTEAFTSHILSLISVNRTVTKQNLIINREAIDDFLFNSMEDLQSFLENNKFLLALYIFAIVNKLFFKQA
jgi:hypothetical protein